MADEQMSGHEDSDVVLLRGRGFSNQGSENVVSIIHCRAGTGFLCFREGVAALQTGGVAVVPAGDSFQLYLPCDAEAVAVSLDHKLIGKIVEHWPALQQTVTRRVQISLSSLASDQLVRQKMLLADELRDYARFRDLAIRLRAASILLTCLRAIPPIIRPEPRLAEADVGIRFISMLERNFKQGWSVGHYAMRLGICGSTLRRACLRKFAALPNELVRARLLNEANYLLEDPQTNRSTVAQALGFTGMDRFCRFFYRHTGNALRENVQPS